MTLPADVSVLLNRWGRQPGTQGLYDVLGLIILAMSVYNFFI